MFKATLVAVDSPPRSVSGFERLAFVKHRAGTEWSLPADVERRSPRPRHRGLSVGRRDPASSLYERDDQALLTFHNW